MRIIIVGCGRIGSELALQMSLQGHDVTLIDKQSSAFRRLDARFKGKTIEGVGFDRNLLIRAGIERADAVVAVTSGDNSNFIIARIARDIFQVPRVVARLYDPRRAEIYQRLGLRTVSSTVWGVSRVMQLLLHRDLTVIATLHNGEVELVELDVPPQWVSRTVSSVNRSGEISVASIGRKGKVIIPVPATEFQDGDQATVVVLSTSRNQLENLMML